MSDVDFPRKILEPILDLPLVAEHVSDEHISWSGIVFDSRFDGLSTGEQALVHIAQALWLRSPIEIRWLHALDIHTRGKTLATIVRSMEVTEVVVHELAVDLYGI